MERIYLTKDEKRVLRLALKRFSGSPSDIPADRYTCAARSLKEKNLIDCVIVVDNRTSLVWLTSKGEDYLCYNPELKNPIPWAKISAITSIVGTIIAIITGIAALISCSILLSMQH